MERRKRKSYVGMARTADIERSYRRARVLDPPAYFRGYGRPGAEKKYFDTAISVEADTTGSLTLLNAMQLGNTAITRVGAQIAITSVEFKIRITNDQAANARIRFGLFVDRQSNGAAPALTDVFTATSDVLVLRNMANRKRFRTLIDKAWLVGTTADTGPIPFQRLFKRYIKFRKPLRVEYNAGNAGTIADIVANSLYFYTFGATANPNGPPVVGNARIRYYDV